MTLVDAPPVPATAVALAGVSKRFGAGPGAVVALDGLSLSVARGEFVCLVGASGCGKTTLLNLVAGLDQPTAGRIETSGLRTALMFQEAALFPWLTVADNVELALRLRGVGRAERRRRAAELLDLVRLGDRVVLLTSRPGRIADAFTVDIARPRRIESADVAALAGTITERLRAEVSRHGR